MYPLKIVFSFIALVLVTSCKQGDKKTSDTTKTESTTDVYVIPNSWIENRVAKAEKRLSESEGGQIVWRAMEAHGGLEQWFKNGSLAMRFNYQPLDGSTQRDSYQVVDVWQNRAVHESIKDSTLRFGFDGENAWQMAKDSTSFAYDTKFWAMTPLYLMGFPFVLDGEGVNFEKLPSFMYKGKANDVVKVTFAPGTGDAPDDYYILHFDAETHLLVATRYIVSYPEYFKDGGHAPEKFMEVGPLENVEGVLLPTWLKTHWTVDGLPGEHITTIEISRLEFKDNLPKDYYKMPNGAEIL